jgi:predicted nucleotidyltransferase
VIHRTPLPHDIGDRIATLSTVLENCPGVLFAYVFGGMRTERPTRLSDVDVAVYLEEGADPFEVRLETVRRAATHLGTDEVDVIVLNTAPTALAGRILQSRQVICDHNPFLRHRFESRALREFFDFRVFEHRLLTRRYTAG